MESYTQTLFDELEAAGIIVKNGKMRPDSKGVLQPVYVIAPEYVNNPEAADELLERLAILDETAGNA